MSRGTVGRDATIKTLSPRRTCPDCGFENAEPEKPCPLCGSSEVRFSPLESEAAPTLQFAVTERMGAAGGPLSQSRVAHGQVFADRYRVEALLGSGGMGQVYRVKDLQEACDRALKILHPRDDDEPDTDRTGRFKREATILAKIQHPAVPRILDSGVSSGQLFIVTELVEGVDLKLAIQKRGPWPVAEAVTIGATLAQALAAAHALGIVHRDVKPNNVMLQSDGAVRLLDFGLARGRGVDMATLTKTGVIVGTPAYMSPEQFQALAVDERSDVYSLGAVLFELLTAKLPFAAPTPMALAMKHILEQAPSPRSLRPEIPVWLDRIVLQCLEKEPGKRFATASALAGELGRSRSDARFRSRRLATGDHVLEDQAEASEWALVLQTPQEKTGWDSGMALRFEERFFRLERVDRPADRGGRFAYRFTAWPAEQIFRKLVDYEQDAAARADENRPISERLSRLFGTKPK